ncbi:hypothetical protein J4730_16175 [Klebsiella pneumoniae]|uniref:Uncharacterized protein n=1 Tax=Klebsiella pneumoniae TaxID=573 RepID=A0A939NKL3_KLEPN|nr:hypothetical protein [Klebsiella pneumoniae]
MQIASSLRGIENCNDKILETENDELIEYWQSVILPDLIHKGERALTRMKLYYISKMTAYVSVLRKQSEMMEALQSKMILISLLR